MIAHEHFMNTSRETHQNSWEMSRSLMKTLMGVGHEMRMRGLIVCSVPPRRSRGQTSSLPSNLAPTHAL